MDCRQCDSPPVALVIPQRAEVFAWKQNDQEKNCRRAGDEWLVKVCEHANATVKSVTTPEQFKDLNAWTIAGATPDDLVEAIKQAKWSGLPRDISWPDALNQSVVSSSELRGLKLPPRKQVLSDWFCEGDLGFLYAYRGAGKTWFALLLAKALSTGGTEGDWKAREIVKVLYIDGEMPRN